MKDVTTMAVDELTSELTELSHSFSERHEGGGLPGEWMVERMDEVETELRRRGLLGSRSPAADELPKTFPQNLQSWFVAKLLASSDPANYGDMLRLASTFEHLSVHDDDLLEYPDLWSYLEALKFSGSFVDTVAKLYWKVACKIVDNLPWRYVLIVGNSPHRRLAAHLLRDVCGVIEGRPLGVEHDGLSVDEIFDKLDFVLSENPTKEVGWEKAFWQANKTHRARETALEVRIRELESQLHGRKTK